MVLKFKTSNQDQFFSIEGESLTIIKVALLEKHGYKTAIHLFQKVIDSGLLFYCPGESDRNNLVNRSYEKYVAEHSEEIREAILTTKEI